MNTTDHQQSYLEEAAAIDRMQADFAWANDAQGGVAHAEALLGQISHTIETVPAHNREHITDLLETAVEALTRITRRLPQPAAPTPSEDPPY